MWHVMGQDAAVEMLERLVVGGRVPQALLLTGPASVGKTTLALDLARALNCAGEDAPCGTCVQCRQIEAGTHPDVSTIESADGKDSIAIGQVRQLRDAASLRPFQGRFKVYIITRAEQLTAQAADALLKTLEEPNPEVVIVLTAADADGLPETVVSRCRTIHMRPVPRARIEEELRRRDADEEQAATLARLSRGSVGWALEALRTPKMVTQQEETVGRLSRVLDMSLGECLDLVESLTGDRKDRAALRRNLETLALLIRDALLIGENLSPMLASGDAVERLRAAAQRVGLDGLRRAFQGLRLAMERIDANVDPRLALEAMMLGLP